MSVIATFDIGTTAVKAVLTDSDSRVLYRGSRDIPTLFSDGKCEQDPRVWWDAFCALSAELTDTAKPDAIVMSGQMQDVIPVDEHSDPLCNAILYCDGRATQEAEALKTAIGAEYLLKTTGNACDGSLSLPKIMWLKAHEPDIYNRAAAFLISSKDYVIARLTGVFAGDHTACSTAGAMDLETREWSAPILKAAGVDPAKMPKLLPSHAEAGRVLTAAAEASGYAVGTPVYCGVGDAGATTLASGIMDIGQYNINLGTSGWVATVSDSALFSGSGVFNLAAMPEGKVINVVPFLNAGNVHRWLCVLFSEDGTPDYEAVNTLLEASVPGANGVTALPYLVGERFPVLDPGARGTFTGITPETTRSDIARAMLEGVGFSIRQGIDTIGTKPVSVSVIGGGGRVKAWCRILADILNLPITVFRDSDSLPAKAISAAARIGLKECADYTSLLEKQRTADDTDTYTPNAENAKLYDTLYRKYLRLYPVMKEWYGE